MSFSATHPLLQQALSARGYTAPTPVQAAILGVEDSSRDLLVSAQTGSGKTVAFGLALSNLLLPEGGTPQAGAPIALVVAPTRELALQVQRELTWLYESARVRVGACVGGMDIGREARMLAQGVHLLVGTPGRLCDHLSRQRLDLSNLQAVVLDEADEMLDMGFREELESLLDAAPSARRTLLFSATIPPEIEAMATRYQKSALRLALASLDEPHRDITWRAVRVYAREREQVVVNTLRAMEAKGALVFCHTREGVAHLYAGLQERGFAVVALSGELSQAERLRALQSLRDGRARVCVATDVAARGIDLPDLGLVIHADLPRDPATLQHRSGRTGRAGRKGTAVLLVPGNQRRLAERLLQSVNAEPIWCGPPTAEDIRVKDEERLLAGIGQLATETAEEELPLARQLIESHSAEALVAAFIRLQRGQLPAPEEVTDPLPTPPASRSLPRPIKPQASEASEASAPGEASDAPPKKSLAPMPREEAASRGRPATVWFRVNVGRNDRADARWILPMLCRRGRVEREVIGKLRIFTHETRFEVLADVAEAFGEAARRPDRAEPHIRIQMVR